MDFKLQKQKFLTGRWIKIRVIQRFANQKVIKKAYICKKKFKV
jgi:hypothetical protein